jgi:phosphomannomutase
VFAQSIVSGTMLESIARAGGFGYAATLTGFKWISRVPHLRFGYEEALGYCIDPDYVRDKDGITAGLLIVELANWLHDRGRSLTDVLDDLDRTHGVHATAQISRRLSDIAQISLLMERLRTRPPLDVAGIAVLRTDDLELGVDGLPPTDGIRLILEAGSRIIVRPSGTEPKVKCYLQVIVPVSGADAGLDDARSMAQDRLSRLRSAVQAWLDPIPD